MTATVTEIAGARAYVLDAEGPPVATDRDAADILGETFSEHARLVVIPTSRLTPAFLDLKTRLAGDLLQKFVNYDRRVVVVGDIAQAVSASNALRDFVRESNRGKTVWFVADMAELKARLLKP